MKQQYSRIHFIFAAFLLLNLTLGCAFIGMIGAYYISTIETPGAESPSFFSFLALCVPFAFMIIASFLVRKDLFRGNIPNWKLTVLLIASILAFCASQVFCEGPMHDIGLMFGSHGRWGCKAINADHSSYYFLNDQTVPWIVWGPSLLAAVGLLFWSRKKKFSNVNKEN